MGVRVVVGCCTWCVSLWPEGEEIFPVRDPNGVKPWPIFGSSPMLLQVAQCFPSTILRR